MKQDGERGRRRSTRIEAEEEARLVEEERLKAEEEEEDLQLKTEEKARLSEGTMLKVKEHERAPLKVEGGSASPLNRDGERRRRRSTHG